MTIDISNNIHTNIGDMNKHSSKAGKLMSTYGAIKLLNEIDGKKQSRDILTISKDARSIVKKTLLVFADNAANIKPHELIFYSKNYANGEAILEALNFGEADYSGGYISGRKEFGFMAFCLNGERQVIPNYAIPKINENSLQDVCAKDNVLRLENRSYYAYTAESGKRYVWRVKDGHIGSARTEYIHNNDEAHTMQDTHDSREMLSIKGILSQLARGCTFWSSDYNKTAKDALKRVGITEGHFTVDAGAGEHHYILKENGNVDDVDNILEHLNTRNWIDAGYVQGQIFKVYGNEYTIDETGHILVSPDDGFKDTEVVYPKRIADMGE